MNNKFNCVASKLL